MNKHPRHTAFRSSQDLIDLRTQLFHSNTQDQKRAIQRILSLETRTKLPHLLQSTAYLLQTKNSFIQNDDSQNETVLQLSSTMCLIRFVNGLLDPSQQSTFAIPLNLLAKKIGLPNWFVELRHSGTHESLPSLEMLEIGINGALDWIQLNYWDKIEIKDDLLDEEEDLENDVDYKDLIRKYRRIRRMDINKFIKFGDSSEEGKEYWKIVKLLEKGIENKKFYKVLMFQNCIINEKYKWEQLRLLFEPLFLYLIKSNDQFSWKLLDKLIFKKYEYEKFEKILKEEETNEEQYNSNEMKQVTKWIIWIVEHLQDQQISKSIEIISKINHGFNIEILQKINEKHGQQNHELKELINMKINSIENSLNKTAQAKINSRLVTEIDDVFADLENLKKKAKLVKTYPIKNFEPYPNWKPKPFGVL
ncbi:LAS1-like protein [Wickerhamomyces ciferrii]|uniref:LAS1-like protein n=1 Tax=Wickerhamomyces ciferrii (strain ATCC 14091 / BCRC 22168 / CBS 111 / JCM 3599 / NBRC 0793 / NRRL Y-1031 F-60-10) TaxID=1206466 RepID=K0KIG7_WICCF|nr:LAS1-like protein [Wickerhamomyces ciferrii]CCH45015.1 LAS1-like protein [Wickerhamomyces ciferrii]